MTHVTNTFVFGDESESNRGPCWAPKHADVGWNASRDLVCIRSGQLAKLRDASAEWRKSCTIRKTGKYGKIMWMESSVRSESGLVSK